MKRKYLFIKWLLLFFPTMGVAKVPEYCNLPNVKTIQTPIFPEDPRSTNYRYSYQFFNTSVDERFPVIIFIPGGPGETSIAAADMFSILTDLNDLPENTNFILTDPRGAGCNQLGADRFPPETISSEKIAYDIVNLVKNLRLKNYILFGHSYGTMVATIAAFQAEQQGVAPRAVILGGVIGRAWGRGEHQADSFSLEWEQAKLRLPYEVVRQLNGKKLPFGIDKERWGTFIASKLLVGSFYVNGAEKNPLLESLLSLKSADSTELAKLRNDILAVDISRPPAPPVDLFRLIACREIEQGNSDSPSSLVKGQLVHKFDATFCRGLSLSSPYDSHDFQLEVPIFYFQGEHDPATPLWQAKYHFQNQLKAPKFFISVNETSHAFPLAGLRNCKDSIWQSIFLGGINLESALKGCWAKVNLEH